VGHVLFVVAITMVIERRCAHRSTVCHRVMPLQITFRWSSVVEGRHLPFADRGRGRGDNLRGRQTSMHMTRSKPSRREIVAATCCHTTNREGGDIYNRKRKRGSASREPTERSKTFTYYNRRSLLVRREGSFPLSTRCLRFPVGPETTIPPPTGPPLHSATRADL
jgi:hypothetical protein